MFNEHWFLLAQDLPLPTDPTMWEKHGLPGLMLLALLGLIVAGLRIHYNERKEWKTEITRIADANIQVAKENTITISTTFERITDKQDDTQKQTTKEFVELQNKMLDRLTPRNT